MFEADRDDVRFRALFKVTVRELMPALVRHASPARRLAFARKVHELGRGADKPFVTIECAKLSESDLERELFSRAVADPHSTKPTVLGASATDESASLARPGGTLFLDCVDALPRRLQARLSLLLKSQPRPDHLPFADPRNPLVRLRLLAGTALDLRVLSEEGKFDLDLFRRLNQVAVTVPDDFEAAIARELLEPKTPHRLSLAELEKKGFRKLKVPRVADLARNPGIDVKNAEPAAKDFSDQDRVRPLFDRLSRRSDKVLESAREEARHLGHFEVGSEHLLLGIAREGSGLAAIVLLELLSDLGKIAPAVAMSQPPGAPPVALGFASSAQAALDTADEVAQDLGRETVDPEHLLIGIARDAECSGAILRSLGLDPATVEARVRIRLAKT